MRIMLTTAVVGALLLMSAGTARATTYTLLDVKVPFTFTVNGQQFPAGQYLVQEDESIGPAVLFLRNMKAERAAIIPTEPAAGGSPAGQPALTFAKGETQNRLTAVWQSSRHGETVNSLN